MKGNDIGTTLDERQSTYGEFKDHAMITQNIKKAMVDSKNWRLLSESKKECLEMVAHKIGRILNGDPDYIENFRDIAGYATLVCRQLAVTEGATDARVIKIRNVGGEWVEESIKKT